MTSAAPPSGPIGRAFAWLGAAAFVLSLCVFVYVYAVRFGRTSLPPPRSASEVLAPVLVNLGWFTLFASHHSLMARSGAKRWLGRHLSPSLERTSYVWVASVLFLVTCLVWKEVPGTAWTVAWPWSPLGHGVQVFGVWLTLRSAGTIDIWDLSGIRQAHGQRVTAPLQVIGPYRWVRHPIYLGWAFLVFGVPEMTNTRLAFACISTAYLALAVPIEERGLVATFGDEYRAYQRRVRWRMVPGLY